MRSLGLGARESGHDSEGRLVTWYERGASSVGVHDSLRDALLLNELFADEELTPDEKAELLPRMVLADPDGEARRLGDDLWPMLSDVLWDAFGIDLDGSRASAREEPVFDWDEDAGRIRSAMRAVYGVDIDAQAGSMSYSTACDLLGGALQSGDNAMRTAVYYRTAKPPARTRHNGDAVDAFEAARSHYRLRGRGARPEDDMAAQNAAMGDSFASARRAARAVAPRG